MIKLAGFTALSGTARFRVRTFGIFKYSSLYCPLCSSRALPGRSVIYGNNKYNFSFFFQNIADHYDKFLVTFPRKWHRLIVLLKKTYREEFCRNWRSISFLFKSMICNIIRLKIQGCSLSSNSERWISKKWRNLQKIERFGSRSLLRYSLSSSSKGRVSMRS